MPAYAILSARNIAAHIFKGLTAFIEAQTSRAAGARADDGLEDDLWEPRCKRFHAGLDYSAIG